MVHVSQRIADYIRRHRLSYILSTRSNGVSRREYVQGRIVIAVMFCAAILTCPLAISGREGDVLPAADMAEFRTGIESIYYNQLSSVPGAFVVKHLAESSESDLGNGTAQMSVSDHISNCEVFEDNNIILPDQFCGQFVEIVLAGIGDCLMETSDFNPLPIPLTASLLTSGQNPLFVFESTEFLAKKFGILDRGSVGKHGEAVYTEVYSYGLPGFRQRQNIFIETERDEVFPGRFLDYRNCRGITFEFSAPSDVKPSKTRNCQPFIRIIIFERRLGVFGRLPVSFSFENRVFAGLAEEVCVRGIEMPQSLLGWNAGNLIEPHCFRRLFPRGEHGACLSVGDGFLFVVPGIRSDFQSPVVYVTAAAEDLFKVVGLFCGRVKSECVPNLHATKTLYINLAVNQIQEVGGNSSVA